MYRAGMPRDTLVLVAKIAAAVVLAGVLVGFALMAATGGGGADDVAVTDPAVPTITGSGGPPASEDTQPAPEPPRETVAAPAVGTQTAVMAPKKPKPKPRPAATNLPGIPDRFEQLGKRCRPAGAVAFTRRFQPLVCQDGHWQWMFRPVG
jgi:hypothetical protein